MQLPLLGPQSAVGCGQHAVHTPPFQQSCYLTKPGQAGLASIQQHNLPRQVRLSTPEMDYASGWKGQCPAEPRVDIATGWC